MNRPASPGRKEFICNLIPDLVTHSKKEKSYKSRYGKTIKEKRITKHKDPLLQHKTMGNAKEEEPDPKNYLKKFAHTFRKLKKPNKKFSYDCGVKKERLPTKDEWIQLPPICDNQNVIHRNAVCAIIQPAYEPERIIVDTRHGHKYKLISEKTHSGLEKRFMFKDGYGEIPKYIRKRISAVSETKDAYEKYLNEKSINKSNYYLTPEQREDLIDGLKKSWDRFNRDYLKLSLSNDTLKFMKYKRYLEGEMRGLEKDIQLVENHRYLFVRPS